MAWRAFGYNYDGVEHEVHVAPVDENGELKEPHVLSEFCCCCPERDEEDPDVIMHNMLH